METSAIVLAGGSSTRLGEDKGVLKLACKPLLQYVVDSVKSAVGEVIIVTSSEERIGTYSAMMGKTAKVIKDELDIRSPLVGAMSGFNAAEGKYCILLPFDTPFVSEVVISSLFDACIGREAAIPQWPNGQIEPLYAVYRTSIARKAAMTALAEGRMDMRGMIEKMHKVRYVSTLALRQFDPELQTFFNINTRTDLQKAVALITERKPLSVFLK